MTYNLLKIGRIAVRRGMLKEVLEAEPSNYIQQTIRDRDIAQVTPETIDSMINMLAAALRLDPALMKDPSALLYRSVPPHDDSWYKTQLSVPGKRKRWVAPGFLHLFITGSGVLTVGQKSTSFEKGDIILHNPNVTHRVSTSSRLCASIVCTVPLHYTWNAVKPLTAAAI